MLKFQSIKDFASTLNSSHKILSYLFLSRKIDLGADTLRDSLNAKEEQQLEKLINRNIVIEEAGLVRLDEGLIDFFELFMDAQTTIDIGKAKDIIDKILTNKQYYLDEKREKKKHNYLRKVKNNLRKANKVILEQIRLLQKNINDVYITETNLKIKLSKLEKLRTQRDIVQKLCQQLHDILKDDVFFHKAMDAELRGIILELRQSLDTTIRNLLHIQNNIIRYIRKAKEQSNNLEHLQKIKILKDQLDLRAKSNIENLLQYEQSLLFLGNITVQSRLSLEQLLTDEGYEIILQTHKKSNVKHQVTLKTAKPIPSEFFKKRTTTEAMINLKQLKTIYEGRGGDLYAFIQEHQFNQPIQREKRIGLFCKMIALFDNELHITNEMKTDNDVTYAIVYLKEKNR